VRPKKSFLEVCIFLGRAVKAAQIRRVDRTSKTKLAHFVQVRHRDQVEAPLTEWLEEAYRYSEHAKTAPAVNSAKAAAKAGGQRMPRNVKRKKPTKVASR
jgi:hypothetical protein